MSHPIALLIQLSGSTWCIGVAVMHLIFDKKVSIIGSIINIAGGSMNFYALYLLVQLFEVHYTNLQSSTKKL